MATPLRAVRIPDEVWESAKQIAEKRGETVTAVVVRSLRRYTRRYSANLSPDSSSKS